MRNDEVLLDAAVGLAAESGWAGLGLNTVARQAGLSQRTMINRFEDRSDLAATLWDTRLAQPLQAAVTELLEAAGLLGESGSRTRFRAAMATFDQPDQNLLAAVELLVMSQFDGHLATAVQHSSGVKAAEWGSPRAGSLTKVDAARRCYAMLLAFGLVAMSRPRVEGRFAMNAQYDKHFEALNSPSKPAALPKVPTWHMGRTTEFQTGDPIRDVFFSAVLNAVAEHGYQGATADVISEPTGYSQATLFSRFGSKAELFLQATAEQNLRSLEANRVYTDRIAEIATPGMADAVTLRMFMRPQLARLRALDSEQMRMSWHDEQIGNARRELARTSIREVTDSHPEWSAQQIRAQVQVDNAMGAGLLLLPLLLPDAWKLPFDVVTVPLLD